MAPPSASAQSSAPAATVGARCDRGAEFHCKRCDVRIRLVFAEIEQRHVDWFNRHFHNAEAAS
jgi:hypothetical protein